MNNTEPGGPAFPRAQHPAPQVPMTEECIRAIRSRTTNTLYGAPTKSVEIYFARAIEAYHGIGVKS